MASRRTKEKKRAAKASAVRRAEQHGQTQLDSLKLPRGCTIWQPKKGTVRIDILPYIVGQNNKWAESGQQYYEYTYYQWRGIGPDRSDAVAIGRTLKQRDPISEHVAEVNKTGTKQEIEEIKGLYPKQRQLFNIVLPDEDSKPGELLFEYSYAGFGNLLDERIKQRPDKWGDFWDAEEGLTLVVYFDEDQIGQNSWTRAKSIDFEERDRQYDYDEVIEATHCLESLLNPLPYEKLKALFFGVDAGDSDDDAPADDDDEPVEPARSRRREPEPEPDDDEDPTAEDKGLAEGDTVEHAEYGLCKITRVSRDGTSLTLEDEDGDEHRAVAPVDVEKTEAKPKRSRKRPEPDDDDEPAPKKPAASKRAKKEPEPDDDGDDWDENDEPAPKKTKAPVAAESDDDWDEGW